jgi:transmembrane sensor
VTSGAARVRAVGTQFDVYRKGSGVTVTVLEGRVAIDDIPAAGAAAALSAEPLLLSAGEQVLVTPKEVRKAVHPNVATATAWTDRQLVFESASLLEVAAEFNRYNARQLVVRDAALYDFHISGVFSSADPGSLIRFLRERPGVRVTESPAEIRVEKLPGN